MPKTNREQISKISTLKNNLHGNVVFKIQKLLVFFFCFVFVYLWFLWVTRDNVIAVFTRLIHGQRKYKVTVAILIKILKIQIGGAQLEKNTDT